MQRGKGFSFSRLMLNAFPPNQASNDPNVDLSPTQADNLLRHQLSLPCPRYLSPLAFFAAGITGSESLSKQVHKALVKAGILLPVPALDTKGDGSGSGDSSLEKMTVKTNKIGNGFASQLAVISVHAQRKLVGLLFFWEEECTRWKLLDDEEAEIRHVLSLREDEEGDAVDLHCALAAVEMKRKMLPSVRKEGVANIGASVNVGGSEELPGYEARR